LETITTEFIPLPSIAGQKLLPSQVTFCLPFHSLMDISTSFFLLVTGDHLTTWPVSSRFGQKQPVVITTTTIIISKNSNDSNNNVCVYTFQQDQP